MMERIADVFVNIPVKSIAKAYTYIVPPSLAFIGVGWRVLVPFGGRKVEGFVVAVREGDPSGDIKLKEIASAVDEECWFSEKMLSLAKWLSDFYLCSFAEMMRLFMPGKSGVKIKVAYEALPGGNEAILSMPGCRAVYSHLLQEGAVERRGLLKALPEVEVDAALSSLLRYKMIGKVYTAEKREAARYEKHVVRLAEVTEELLAGFTRKPAQKKLLKRLAEVADIPLAALREEGVSLATVHTLEEAGLVRLEARRVLRDSYADACATRQEVTLTEEQEVAIRAMEAPLSAGEFGGFLLKGVTGSGKTRVYIELARRTRELGRTVIVLVPEIALTGQVVTAFKAEFPEDIVVVHSGLSLAERNDAMVRVRRREGGILIGARSALFTPAEEVGLVILDEEQDMSYKQDESPRYHARVVAEELAKLHGAVLLLGSATPSLESYAKSKAGKLTLLTMTRRIGDVPLPAVHCVDMRQELRMGNRHILSRALRQLIESTIAKGQQVILMLNRRGFSTFVMCRSCGEVIRCRDCGLPMVYHKDGRLLCHHCDTREPVPTVCPKCQSRYIRYFGSGTEKLEEELKALVPRARVIRMDRDTTTTKFAHQNILDKFRRHEYDILLGTQMVAKGHDIPNVTAVGIISADSALGMPDFRAAERCFMLITQTAGRAGRHGTRGEVVIQTYNPTHYAVERGIAQDYEGFFRQEIASRKEAFYPPYCRLVKLLYQNESEEAAKAAATKLIEAFRTYFPGEAKEEILGPSPAVIAKFRGIYRFVVLIKTVNLPAVQAFLREQGLHLDTSVAIDIDPITML